MRNLDGATLIEEAALPVEVMVVMHVNEDEVCEKIEVRFLRPVPCYCMDQLDSILNDLPDVCSCIGEGLQSRAIIPEQGKNAVDLVRKLVRLMREQLQELLKFISRVIEGTEYEGHRMRQPYLRNAWSAG